MTEKNSLWKNIRNKAAQNRRTGATPKKPTTEMLEQERKIKAKYPDGGPIKKDGYLNTPVEQVNTGSLYNPVSNKIHSDPNDPANALPHEYYHAWQHEQGRDRIPELYDGPLRQPQTPYVDELTSNYYNRRGVEVGEINNEFRSQNPSFNFVPDDVMYDKYTNDEMYYRPYTMEGEARATESPEGRAWLNQYGILPQGIQDMYKAEGGPVNTLEGDLISKVIMNRNKDKDFVKRAYAVGEYPESNMFVQPDANQFGEKNSHLMSWGEDESGQAYMYPEVMNPNNEAVKVPNQYADYISSTGYKKVTGIPHAEGGYYPTQGPGKALFKGYAEGGNTNPYNQYQDDPYLQYEVGGKVWKNIAAGLYGAGEGILDTVTMGATDELTDKGFEALSKAGNKNIDLNNPDDVKFLKSQQKLKGYGNTAGAIGTAAVTGNVQGAIKQGTKGLNTAFQATDGMSDEFKKWSQGVTGVAGVASGFAGGLNSQGFNDAAKAGTGVAGFGQKVGKYSPLIGQASGFIGGNDQALWQQGDAQQKLLNSPDQIAEDRERNRSYTNQGLMYGQGGNMSNNSLNLRNTMGYNRFAQGGAFNQYGINMIPESAGLHHQSAYGGVPIGPNALAEGGEIKMDNGDGSQYIVSDQVDGADSQKDFTFSKGGKYKELNRTLADGMKQDLNKYTYGSLATSDRVKGDLRRPNDSYAQSTVEQIKQKWQQKTEYARQRSQHDQAIAQAEEQKRMAEEQYIAAYGGRINPKKYPGLNYAKGGIHIKPENKGKFTASANAAGHTVQEHARAVLNDPNATPLQKKRANFARNAAGWNHADGGYVHNQMIQPMLAEGGPLYGDPASPYTYALGGVGNNINTGQPSNQPRYTSWEDMRTKMNAAQAAKPRLTLDQQRAQDSQTMGRIGQIFDSYNHPNTPNLVSSPRPINFQVPTGYAEGGMYGDPYARGGQIDYTNDMYSMYAGGGPMPSDLPQAFDGPAAQNSNGMYLYPDGGPSVIPTGNQIYTPDSGIEQYAADPSWYDGGNQVAAPGNVVSWPSYPENYGDMEDPEGVSLNMPTNDPRDRNRRGIDFDFDINLRDIGRRWKHRGNGRPSGRPMSTRPGATICTVHPDGGSIYYDLGGILPPTTPPTINPNLDQNPKFATDTTVQRPLGPVAERPPGYKPQRVFQIGSKGSAGHWYNLDSTDPVERKKALEANRENQNRINGQMPISPTIRAEGGMMPPEQQMQQQGGQDQMMQMVEQVAQAISGGANPEQVMQQVMQQLVQAGAPEEQAMQQAQQIVQAAMQEVQGQQQQQPMQEGQQMPPQQGMARGGYFNGRKQYGDGDYSIYPTQPTTYKTTKETDQAYPEVTTLDPFANKGTETSLPEQDITPMHWSWYPKEENSKSDNSKKKEKKSSEYSPADIAAAALQLAGPAHQFFQKKPEAFQYKKGEAKTLDPSTAIMLADQALRESEAGAGYAIRQAAPTAGSYLANIRANALDFGKKRGQSSAGIRSQYDLQNTGILNQFEQYNTDLENKAIDAMQQDEANYQEQRTNALYNAGANLAGMRKDFKAAEIDKIIANNIGTTNYRLSPDGKTITYVNSNGKTVTIPAEAATTNTTQNTTQNTTTDASTDSGTTADVFTMPNELQKGNETKAFQDFLDAGNIPWYKGSKLGKGKGYGTFGPNTKAAYDKYKEMYAEKQKQAARLMYNIQNPNNPI